MRIGNANAKSRYERNCVNASIARTPRARAAVLYFSWRMAVSRIVTRMKNRTQTSRMPTADQRISEGRRPRAERREARHRLPASDVG